MKKLSWILAALVVMWFLYEVVYHKKVDQQLDRELMQDEQVPAEGSQYNPHQKKIETH